MIQNIITLAIVFLTAAYTLYSIIKSLTLKTNSKCGGCSGCALKDHPSIKHASVSKVGNRNARTFMLIK